MSNLNDAMEFDHVIRVHEDGSITDEPGVYAPNLWEGELDDDRWTLLNGYSGQYRYAGPVMHDSEFIGGQMERDILSEPGVYVALVCYWDPDTGDDVDVEGWGVARLDEG